VHGLENLAIVDASVMPSVISRLCLDSRYGKLTH